MTSRGVGVLRMGESIFIQWFGMTREQLVARLRSLADDLETSDGKVPPPNPTVVLDQWAIAKRAVPCLVGIPSGHPVVEDGKPCFSSELFFIDERLGIARSFSRWYRLGKQVDPGFWNKRLSARQ